MYSFIKKKYNIKGGISMAKKGILLLPPSITKEQALDLYRLLAKVNIIIGQLKSEFQHSMVHESLISMFSLKESVQSTRIEGTQVTFAEMIEHETKTESWEQREVPNYHLALHEGWRLLRQGNPISTRLIKRLHGILMDNARGTNSASGEFRKIQNFIGPDNNIEHAVYIPVPANEIDNYMENLEFFINGELHRSFRKENDSDKLLLDEKTDSIIKIAITHAQFESIHPFLDGNGRLGRILIALMAIKTGLVDFPVFLVSEELEKERARYYDLLNGIRGKQPNWYPWLKFFIGASLRMSTTLLEKLRQANELATNGLKKCRLESERKLWMYSFSNPITTAPQAANELGMSVGTARKVLNHFAEIELLYAEKNIKHNRKYRNYDLIRILN